MPRGIKKIKTGISKVLDAKTKANTVDYLTETAFIQMYSAFNIQKADGYIKLTAVIDGETFDLTFKKK